MNRQLFEYHPLIGYRFIPDLKTRVTHEAGGYLVKTNNIGFRSEIDFYNEKKSPEQKRVLFFGDSFTAGDGVSNKFRFTDLLQAARPDLEVYNFALSATGTDQQYLIYREYANRVEADLIVIMVLVENIRRVNAHYRYYHNENGEKVLYQKPYFELGNGDIVLKNTPVKKETIKIEDAGDSKIDRGGRFESLRILIKKIGLQAFVQNLFKYQPMPEYNSAKKPEWLLMKAVLKKWISELDKKKVLLVPLPLYQYIEETSSPKQYQKRFQELAAELNIELFDPLDDLKKYPKEQRRAFRFKTDVHLTPEGHKAVFESIQKKINQLV